MIIKILAGIGMAWVFYVAYILLKCSWERFKRWRKTGCKIKMLCKPHIYDFYCLWPDDGELTLKCKKCGKFKKLYIDVENWNKMIDCKVAERTAETDKELLSWFLSRLFKKDVISAETEIEAGKQIGKFLYDVRWKESENEIHN